jgi:hypothetical protein
MKKKQLGNYWEIVNNARKFSSLQSECSEYDKLREKRACVKTCVTDIKNKLDLILKS